MARWSILCESWDDVVCMSAYDTCELVTSGNVSPKGQKCPRSDAKIVDATRLEEDDDYEEKKAARRPGWYPGRRKQVRDRGTSPGGTLTCPLCKKPIEVNAQGKEEWVSKSGTAKATSPHLDHYNDDWVVREKKLRKTTAFRNASEAEQKDMLREKFNESPLRTVHMLCNLCRAKQ